MDPIIALPETIRAWFGPTVWMLPMLKTVKTGGVRGEGGVALQREFNTGEDVNSIETHDTKLSGLERAELTSARAADAAWRDLPALLSFANVVTRGTTLMPLKD